MLKRPSSSETEEDLLALQEQFLTSKKQPSAELRRPQTETFFSSVDQKSRRDVVTLKDISPKSQTAATEVKSISSENNLTNTIDPLNTHESYLVLKDIKESNLNPGDVPMITSHQTKSGFPIVMKLPSIQETTGKPDGVKKKSLFAQQFDSLSPVDFGLSVPVTSEREVVRERVDLVQMTSHQEDAKITQDNESKFASLSSATWSKFLQSAFVSGQGLVAAGATPKSAQQEIAKIHEENVSTLSALTEKEILEEQEKVKRMLDPKVVAFLQSRRSQPTSTPSLTTEPVVKTNESSLLDQQGWLNMDVVEKEKMKWTTDIPVATETPQAYRDVRFSLKGVVISRDIGTTIPSYLGLHHHGNEPESAGYTMEELFVLARSSFQQQKIFSLQILSCIVKRALHNEYIDVIEGSVFDILMESGLPSLFRYALDESSDSLQAVAVTCIHSLLVSPAEEHFLYRYYCCSNGMFVPSLSPVMEVKIKEDLIRYDIVKGLLDMMLLPRLRYILEVCQPQEVVMVKILEILIRVARHSLQAANEVMKCPRLINLIIEWFLPSTWSNENGGDIYKRPHPLAMRLLYTLCIAGRYIAQELLSSYRLLSCVLQHAIVHPQEQTPLPNNDTYILSVESLRTWNLLIRYGLTTDTLSYYLAAIFCLNSDIFPTLLKCFIAISSPFTLSSCELQRTLSIFHVLSGSIIAAAVLPNMLQTEQTKEPHPPLSINWSQVRGVVDPALKCLARILRECQDISDDEITLDRLQYITALINIASTFYSEYNQKPELRSSPVDLLEEVESVAGNILKLFFQSKLYPMAFKTITASLKSLTSATPSPSLPRYVPLLPSKPALYGQDPMEEKDYPYLTQSLSTLTVFSDILCVSQQLCLSLIQLHHGLSQTLIPALISEEFWSYLEWFCKPTPLTMQVNLSCCSLYLYLYSVVQTLLSAVESLTCYQLQLLHSCALRLVSLFPPGYEEILNKLVNNTIFHTSFYRDILDKLATDPDLKAPLIATFSHSEAPPTTTADLIKVAVAKLPSIKDTYNHYCQNMGLKEKDVMRSSHWLNHNPIKQDTYLFPPFTDSVLPSSWMYFPLLIEYTAAVKGEYPGHDNIGTGAVSNVLYYLVLLERCRYDVINTTPPILRLALIMSTFLIDSGLFFESEIRQCLSSLYFSYTSSTVLTSLNFSLPIPGLASFQDFYTSLLDQFAAVSYGDQLFASYLLIPLLQRYPVSFRKDFWIDHTHILNLIHLSPTQINIPVDSFLSPIEQDWDLLEQYLKILASCTIHLQKNSLLYLIAVHHVNSFIFQDISEMDPINELCKNLFFAVLGLPDKSLQRNLLFYNGPSITGSNDIQLSDKFTSSQIEIITTRFSSKLPSL